MTNRRLEQAISWSSVLTVALLTTLALPRAAEARRRGNPDAVLKKMGPYIYGLNRLTPSVSQSYRQYTQNMADKKAGPTCREYAISLGVVRPKDTCRSIKRASGKGPRLPALEKAGKAYCRAALKLEKLHNALSSYYRTRAYKLDACKKAQRAHAKLMKEFREFFAANRTIRGEVARLQQEVDAGLRKQLKRRYGMNMRYYRHVGPREARRALRIAYEEQSAKAPRPKRVLAAAEEVARLVKTMEGVALKHDRKAVRSGFRSYVTYMRLLSRELTRYAEKLEQKGAKQAEYFYKKVVSAFNTMIAHVNRVSFRKGMR